MRRSSVGVDGVPTSGARVVGEAHPWSDSPRPPRTSPSSSRVIDLAEPNGAPRSTPTTPTSRPRSRPAPRSGTLCSSVFVARRLPSRPPPRGARRDRRPAAAAPPLAARAREYVGRAAARSDARAEPPPLAALAPAVEGKGGGVARRGRSVGQTVQRRRRIRLVWVTVATDDELSHARAAACQDRAPEGLLRIRRRGGRPHVDPHRRPRRVLHVRQLGVCARGNVFISFVRSFARSFVRSFVRSSFVRSFCISFCVSFFPSATAVLIVVAAARGRAVRSLGRGLAAALSARRARARASRRPSSPGASPEERLRRGARSKEGVEQWSCDPSEQRLPATRPVRFAPRWGCSPFWGRRGGSLLPRRRAGAVVVD